MSILLVMIGCVMFWGTLFSAVCAIMGKINFYVPVVATIVTAIYTILVVHHVYGQNDHDLPDTEIEDVDEALKEYRHQGDAED